jgi:NDP-sugar pyrophosphorylase family protein
LSIPVRAVILAGGKGKRLYPYTKVVPKPLVQLGQMPILEIVVRQLASQGIEHITICTGFQAEQIRDAMGDGSKWNVRIDYSHEDEPLSTIGPLTLVDGLDDTFLVMNGDLLTDIKYQDMIAFHKKANSVATIATYKKQVQLSLGVMQIDPSKNMKTITGFEEKPTYNFDVSMGIYLFEPRVFDFIPKKKFYGFDHLMYDLLDAKETITAFEFDGHWLDMGTHEDLDKAIEEFEAHADRYLPL